MERFNEASTWAGLSGMAQGAKLLLPPQWGWVADLLSVAFGGVAVKMRERGG